jgi:hypothetical protein
MVKIITNGLLAAFIFFLNFSSCSALDEKAYETYHKVDSEVSFRSWDEKGLGKVIKKNTISVLMPRDRRNDIVILRWSKDEHNYSAEVYKADITNGEAPTSWNLDSADKEKTLTDQHGQFFLIFEMIPGENGGQQNERFVLQTKK